MSVFFCVLELDVADQESVSICSAGYASITCWSIRSLSCCVCLCRYVLTHVLYIFSGVTHNWVQC